jgi:hypothetical protein
MQVILWQVFFTYMGGLFILGSLHGISFVRCKRAPEEDPGQG